jgi:oligoribonuclease NrnB/cAMP/cGMP phosphodiesterase (DHH superfamily)
METKVYTYQKKYTRADGTVTYYETKTKYNPVNAAGQAKQTRKKREGSINQIVVKLRNLNKEQIETINKYIDELNGGEIRNDNQ